MRGSIKEADILALKEVKKCIGCGAEINQKDDFCSKCGKEQPKQEVKTEVKAEDQEEMQEVKEADVTEIKDVPQEENENHGEM